jgi:patatin-like phospholipase/acyl hydrolase
MKLIFALVGAIFASDYYNILTIDGGGIRGIIPATTISRIESYAFEYASEKGYTFPKYTNMSS